MMLKVTPILCRAGKMDNYAYLLQDSSTLTAAVLDASEAVPIIAECKKQNVKPQFLFNTHHHFDHVEGNLELKQLYNAKQKLLKLTVIPSGTFYGIFQKIKFYLREIHCLISVSADYLKARRNKCGILCRK